MVLYMTEPNSPAATFAAINAAAAGVTKALLDAKPSFDKTLAEIGKIARGAAEAMAIVQARRAEQRNAVIAALRDGIPETAVASAAGVTRQTVRDWAGKPKRGDIVTAEPYGDTEPGEPFHMGSITGRYVPRTDHLGAKPPADAAWVDDGDPQGPWMVKAATVKVVR